jgi:hypothetical protein
MREKLKSDRQGRNQSGAIRQHLFSKFPRFISMAENVHALAGRILAGRTLRVSRSRPRLTTESRLGSLRYVCAALKRPGQWSLWNRMRILPKAIAAKEANRQGQAPK